MYLKLTKIHKKIKQFSISLNINQASLEQNLNIFNNFIDEYLFVINQMIFEFLSQWEGAASFIKIWKTFMLFNMGFVSAFHQSLL